MRRHIPNGEPAMHKQRNATEQAVRRTTFDQAARAYDAIRPGYPSTLIEDVISISALPKNGRILEIGGGTGQATIPFAQRGYSIMCVELGKELATLAAEKLRHYPNAEVVNKAFEDWQPEEHAFDLFMSATAFHWIPPEIGYPKAARVLQDSGYLAVFSNEHPKPYSGFFEDVQHVYEHIVPEWSKPNSEPSISEAIQSTAAYINRTGLFEPVLVRTYPWVQDYTTHEYRALLNTYSDHRNLDENRRMRLYDAISELIENKYDGMVTKSYLAVLYIARKRVQM